MSHSATPRALRVHSPTWVALLLVFAAGVAPGCTCIKKPAGDDGSSSGSSGNPGGDGGGNASSSSGGTSSGGDAGNPGCGLVTCQSAGSECGPIGDGCGSTVWCGQCVPPKTCGGGGQAFKCGGSQGCVPKTCTDLGANCGPVGDTCNTLLQCGDCPPGQTCGFGGANKCGSTTNSDGGAGVCVPRTCADANATCGSIGDGCGHVLTCNITACTGTQTCGGGGVANQCGSPTCTARTCVQASATCGTIGNGCGATLDCNTQSPACPPGQSCGGGGVANQCGAPVCVAKDCTGLNATCGAIGNGCGQLIPTCGTCDGGVICGGGGTPNVCGTNIPGGGACTNLCLRPRCDAGNTTVSGKVVAPGHADTFTWGQPDPIYKALVYVPNGTVQAFTPGVACDKCGAGVTGQPLGVPVETAVDGTFTLDNVPCGANVNVPLVIQLGRWRRQIVIPNVTCCGNTQLALEDTRLPRNHNEGDIPLIAMVTGNVDILECVLRKIGIEDSEFAVPSATGGQRVRVYRGENNPGADVTPGAPGKATLVGSTAELAKYDMVLFACEGNRNPQSAADLGRVVNYANTGGRVFSTHFSYTWLTNSDGTVGTNTAPRPFSQTADWLVDQGQSSTTGVVDQTFPKGVAFAQWLQNTGASTTLGQVTVNVVRHDFNAVNAPAQRWLYEQGTTDHPLHYTFNTPIAFPPDPAIPVDQQCGRVLFSDFHVSDASGAGGAIFPGECSAGPMTAQEKTLEFMLFDLASCIQPDIPTCSVKNCAQQGFNCGQQGDGCGGVVDAGPNGCGVCTPPQICGGGGPGKCGGGCTPKNCAAQGFNCGQQGDTCGGLVDAGPNGCGTCPPPQVCGGGGQPGVCNGGCVPRDCAAQNFNCGQESNGCGVLVDCGTCTPPDTCGGGGVPGRCGRGATGCVKKTCTDLGLHCGPAGDGCGGTLDCGPCTPPDTCGGGGVNGTCGHPTCTPRTCAQANAACGIIGDGCGLSVDCGECTQGICGGSNVPNQCGFPG